MTLKNKIRLQQAQEELKREQITQEQFALIQAECAESTPAPVLPTPTVPSAQKPAAAPKAKGGSKTKVQSAPAAPAEAPVDQAPQGNSIPDPAGTGNV